MVTEACRNPLCQNQINITENGEAVVQESSYNVRNHEAVLRVPAHSSYGDNAFVMVGRDADSELAGKMMSIEGDSCELHDIPDFVNVEDLGEK